MVVFDFGLFAEKDSGSAAAHLDRKVVGRTTGGRGTTEYREVLRPVLLGRFWATFVTQNIDYHEIFSCHMRATGILVGEAEQQFFCKENRLQT